MDINLGYYNGICPLLKNEWFKGGVEPNRRASPSKWVGYQRIVSLIGNSAGWYPTTSSFDDSLQRSVTNQSSIWTLFYRQVSLNGSYFDRCCIVEYIYIFFFLIFIRHHLCEISHKRIKIYSLALEHQSTIESIYNRRNRFKLSQVRSWSNEWNLKRRFQSNFNERTSRMKFRWKNEER